jgi:glycosyltransferase involved in cell wall biosynthesis
MRKSISIILPIYNEEKNLEVSINKMYFFFKKNRFDFEIIIVESGSTDNSLKICKILKKRFNRLIIVVEKKKRGYGSAVKLGVSKSKKNFICIYHPDQPFSLNFIKKYYPYTRYYDFVLSYRSDDKRNFFRKIQSSVYNKSINFLFRINIKHINSAFKIIKSAILKGMQLKHNNWLIDLEILLKMKKNNYNYIELPTPILDRKFNKSKVSYFTFLGIFIDVFFLFFKKKKY